MTQVFFFHEKVAVDNIVCFACVRLYFLFIAKLNFAPDAVEVLVLYAVDVDDRIVFRCFLPAYF